MGYQISYQPIKKIRGKEKLFHSSAAQTAFFFSVFLILVHFFWPEGDQFLREYLFPESITASASAVETFADELAGGDSFFSAFARFINALFSGNAV